MTWLHGLPASDQTKKKHGFTSNVTGSVGAHTFWVISRCMIYQIKFEMCAAKVPKLFGVLKCQCHINNGLNGSITLN